MIRRDNFLLIPSALLLESPPSMDQWESMGSYLLSMQRSLYWWIGDMLVNGESQIGDDIYQAFDPSFSVSLIERCAAVSRAFPLGHRNTNLSWTHHQALLGFSEPIQRTALRKAEIEGWDTAQFKRYLQEIR